MCVTYELKKVFSSELVPHNPIMYTTSLAAAGSPNLASSMTSTAAPPRDSSLSPDHHHHHHHVAAVAAAAVAGQHAERLKAAAAASAFKVSNFSIAALMNKDNAEDLERRRRQIAETLPMLGRTLRF